MYNIHFIYEKNRYLLKRTSPLLDLGNLVKDSLKFFKILLKTYLTIK